MKGKRQGGFREEQEKKEEKEEKEESSSLIDPVNKDPVNNSV